MHQHLKGILVPVFRVASPARSYAGSRSGAMPACHLPANVAVKEP